MNPPKDYAEEPLRQSDLSPTWFAWSILALIFLTNAVLFYCLA